MGPSQCEAKAHHFCSHSGRASRVRSALRHIAASDHPTASHPLRAGAAWHARGALEALMAGSGQWLPAPPQFAAWDDAALSRDEAQRISSVLRYTVRTFYVPVSFEFTFDDQRRLVGKHIYD